MVERAPTAIITLTTDFGLADPYVAAMKGVILTLHPGATIVDISHDLRPQRLLQAVFITQQAWAYFPDAVVHVVVVDPGVGTARRALALETPRGRFLGPDNGVLSAALPDKARRAGGDAPSAIDLPEGYRAVAITERRVMREPVSVTFHGRDVFAPAAAHLALGAALTELGEPAASISAFPPLRARQAPDGALLAQVVHIDRFGNVITDIRDEDLPERFGVELAGRRVPGPARTYAEASGLAAIVGSAGYLEVALPNGDAARMMGVEIGDAVVLRPER